MNSLIQPTKKILLRLPMRLMLAAIRAEFLHLDALGSGALVLCLTVIAVLALTALQLDNFTRHCQLLSFLFLRLRQDLRDGAGAYRAATFSNCKPQPFLHRNRRDQLDL